MSGVFQNIDPPTRCGGRTHSLGGEGGGGSIFWKTPDTALYSTYVSTLWLYLSPPVSWYRTNARTLPWRTTAKTEKVGTVPVLVPK
jgi:hypothetical protein